MVYIRIVYPIKLSIEIRVRSIHGPTRVMKHGKQRSRMDTTIKEGAPNPAFQGCVSLTRISVVRVVLAPRKGRFPLLPINSTKEKKFREISGFQHLITKEAYVVNVFVWRTVSRAVSSETRGSFRFERTSCLHI